MPVLVIAVDYDDCLVRKYNAKGELRLGDFDGVDFNAVVNQHIPPQGKEKWQRCLLTENSDFETHLKEILRKKHYDKVILWPSSARQFPHNDTANSCRGDKGTHIYSGSCYAAAQIYREHLCKQLGIEIELDLTTTADYFRKCAEGSTAQSTLKWLQTGQIDSETLFNEFPNDRTKISLHYFGMHKFKGKFPQAEVDYLAIDDSYQGKLHEINPAILDAIKAAYGSTIEFMPPSTNLWIMPYQNGVVGTPTIISSPYTNVLDKNPFENMHNMMVCSLDGETYQEKSALLRDIHSCDCWALFSDPDKKQQFTRVRNQVLSLSAAPVAYAAHFGKPPPRERASSMAHPIDTANTQESCVLM